MEPVYLPLEIISKIFSHLKPSDWLNAGLTCKLWYTASLCNKLWQDVKVVISNSLEHPAVVLKHSYKPIQHIIIRDVSFTSTDNNVFDFFERVGPSLVSLDISNSYVTESNLLKILLCCSGLKSLHVKNCRDLFLTGKLLYNGLVLERVKKTMPRLSNLHLDDNLSYLSDALVDRFISLVTHLKSLSLAGTVVSFHPGIYQRFYPQTSEARKPSESVLTFQMVLEHVRHNSSSIESLDFSKTTFNDKAAAELSEVEKLKLKRLVLRGCDLGTTGISNLCKSQQSLTELDLSSCARITDSAVVLLANGLPNLVVLSLQSCRSVTDSGISALAQLTALQRINLRGLERITAVGVEQGLLSRVNNLKRINLCATRIAAETIGRIARTSSQLTHLDLTSCVPAVCDASLPNLWARLRYLTHLRIDWCVGLGDSAFISAQESGLDADLKRLNITEDEQRPAVDIANLSALVYLSLCGCANLTDATLTRLHFRELRHLNLASCKLVTDTGLLALSRQNPSLEVLILSQCANLTDDGVAGSVKTLKRLRALDLQGCHRLTDGTLVAIGECSVSLSYLSVSHCPLMTTESTERMWTRLPRLRELGPGLLSDDF